MFEDRLTHEQKEILLHIENTPLFNSRLKGLFRNISRYEAVGQFSRGKAHKALLNFVREVHRYYMYKYSQGGEMLNSEKKKDLADYLIDEYYLVFKEN